VGWGAAACAAVAVWAEGLEAEGFGTAVAGAAGLLAGVGLFWALALSGAALLWAVLLLAGLMLAASLSSSLLMMCYPFPTIA